MGWYIRKSVKVGPLRLNLSKSGIGYSLGMKGLRVGTGPRGPYVAGGRYGLYFRQSLKGVAKQPKTSIIAACPPPAAPGAKTGGGDTLGQSSYCTNCGACLISGNQFCIECGTKYYASMQLSESPTRHISFLRLALFGLAAATVFILFKIALSIL